MSYRNYVVEDDSGCVFGCDKIESAISRAESLIDEERDKSEEYGQWLLGVEDIGVFAACYQSVKVDVETDGPEEPLCDYELQPTPEWQRIQEQLKELESAKAELKLYKSKTPHTADGVPIFVGNRVWTRIGNETLNCEVNSIGRRGLSVYVMAPSKYKGEWIRELKYFYSTLEALETAMKGGES